MTFVLTKTGQIFCHDQRLKCQSQRANVAKSTGAGRRAMGIGTSNGANDGVHRKKSGCNA